MSFKDASDVQWPDAIGQEPALRCVASCRAVELSAQRLHNRSSAIPSRRILLWIAATLILTGCASTSPSDLRSEIPGAWMSCNRPYELKQDCSIWSGATREIEINGVQVKVAGTADGRVILVMPADMLKHSFGGDIETASAKATFEVVMQLESRGVTIEHQIPVVTSGKTQGSVLEVDQDGYALLTARES